MRFAQWLTSTDYADFTNAQGAVKGLSQNKARWPERAAWARTYMHELELEALGAMKPVGLPPADPWQPYLPRLAPSLRILVTRGCLAFGTRTGVMVRLADALAELVDPVAAKKLLRYWVENRNHNSEDIHAALQDVLEFADRCVDDAFEGRGLPEAVWKKAGAAIHSIYLNIAAGHTPLTLTEVECRRAAFYLLGLFYQVGRGHTFIAAEQFGLALEYKNVGGLPVRRPNQSRVADVRSAMTRINLLKMVGAPRYLSQMAGEYELKPPFWPPPPPGGGIVCQP